MQQFPRYVRDRRSIKLLYHMHILQFPVLENNLYSPLECILGTYYIRVSDRINKYTFMKIFFQYQYYGIILVIVNSS